MIYFPKGACPGQQRAIERLHNLLNEPVPVRVGETAVVSTKVHVQDPAIPHKVTAIMNADAGQVFYHRNTPGEIIHIDVFHSEGKIAPEKVARSLINALYHTELEDIHGGPGPSLKLFVPYIDIQTAAGGGRLDGSLAHGREQGVRQAHITHVHLTMLNVHVLLSCIFVIVGAVESAIQDAGLELRKVGHVALGSGNTPMDLGDYQTVSDSFLRGPGGNLGTDASSSTAWYRAEALAKQAAHVVGTAHDALDLLEALSTGMHPEELTRFRGPKGKKPGEIRRALSKSELIQLDRHGYKLTAQGELALDYLRRHAAEIEAYLRRLLWSLPATSIPAPERTATVLKPGNARSRGYALPKARGDLVTQLAVAETIIAKGTAKGPLKPEHLRFWYTRQKKSRPVVLLLDTSASMAGRRMAAAKEFARHLLVTSKEKVCVVIFQDSRVEVICDFTRNPRKLEAGLSRIQAEGLTPLAKGLETVGELCRGKMIKPLVLCVTDGIPTVPYRTLSPIEDAISAARNLAKQGIRIGCIGLQPNRSFLREMMGAARGSLYIVDELEASTMAAIARKEQKE